MSVMQVIAALGSGPTVGFPVYLSNTATDLGGADATSHLVQMPAAVTTGDLLLALIALDGTATITTPSGWTSLPQGSDAAVRGAVFYKVAAGTEGGTTVDFVSSSAERMEAQVVRIQVGTFQSVPESAFTMFAVATVNPDSPNLTPSWGSANTLWLSAGMLDNTRTVSSYPLPNNNFTTANAGSGIAFTTLISCSNNVAAASLDPAAWTINTASRAVMFTIAIRPV